MHYKDLFRRLVGDASYQVLLMARKHTVTSTLPCLAATLLKLRLVEVAHPNPMTVGTANHATIMDFRITADGREFLEHLGIDEDMPI